MAGNGFQSLSSVKFEDIQELFDTDSAISMEQVEQFLDKAVQHASQKAKVQPNQLVKIIYDDKVTWITQSQAREYLSRSENPDLQKQVRRALTDELRVIQQELEILHTIASYSFNQFKRRQAISKKDVERIEPSLKRREREITDGLSETANCESLISTKRRNAPILDEYESMMGEFINEKNKGNESKAVTLAKQLAKMKSKYLLYARSIEPDVQSLYHYRLNLQKTKRRLINTQNQICYSRKDFLGFEMEELYRSIQEVQGSIAELKELGLDTLSHKDNEEEIQNMAEAQRKLESKKSEMSALDTESKILEKQEKEVTQVINHISENVLQESESKVNMDSVKRHSQTSIPKQKPQEEERKKKSARMHYRGDD